METTLGIMSQKMDAYGGAERCESDSATTRLLLMALISERHGGHEVIWS